MSVRRETRCLCRDTRYGSTPLQLFFSTADGALLEDLTLAFPPHTQYYKTSTLLQHSTYRESTFQLRP